MRTLLARLLIGGTIAALPAGGPMLASPQESERPAGQAAAPAAMSMPMYDKTAEATFTGVVEAVTEMNHAGMMGAGRGARQGMPMPEMPMRGMPMDMGMTGIHLTLKTDKELLEVHVGPSTFLAERKLTITKGDRLQVLGARATMNGQPIVIARQVTKEGATVTLRDETGRPLWQGRGR